MTLAWSYFGIWAIRFFFLWTLVYAENRNSLNNVSGHMYNSLKYEIQNKWDGMGWRKIEKGGSMCVNFLCRSVLTFWGGKFSQKFGSESKATSAVSRELWHAAFCVFCLDWTLYFSKERYRICLPPGIKYKYMRQGPLPNMIKHCWVIDSKLVLRSARIKKPTVPLFQNPNYQHATTVCKSQFQFGCKFEIIVSCHWFAPVICFVLFVNLCWGAFCLMHWLDLFKYATITYNQLD